MGVGNLWGRSVGIGWVYDKYKTQIIWFRHVGNLRVAINRSGIHNQRVYNAARGTERERERSESLEALAMDDVAAT